MLNKEDLKMLESKAKREFKNQYEKEHEELLMKIKKDFIKSIKSTEEYFQLDYKKYKEYLKGDSDLNKLRKYLRFKGFEIYGSPDGYLNVYLIENN